MADRPVSVVVADDSVLLRDGLTRLLEESGFEVLATVSDGDALVVATDATDPDLVIVDVRMPPSFTNEGIHAALRIRERRPDQAIVVLSQYVEERYAADLLADHGVGTGYLLKDRVVDIADFVSALRRVAGGGSAIDAEVVGQLLARSRRRSELDRLSPRECEVLEAMAEGRSNTGIAEKLVISLGAVEKHIGNVFAKLDLDPVDTAHRRVLAVLAFLGQRR